MTLAHAFSGKAKGGGTATEVSRLAIPADAYRKALGIFNNSDDDIMWLSFGSAAVAGQGIPLYPHDGYEMGQYSITPDDIHIVMDAGKTGSYSWYTGR